MTNADDIDAIRIGPDPDKLLVYHRQQLSAMLDGELSPDEAKFMLRRLQHDRDLAECWERWQVCGDMLRGTHHALLPSDFAERVARAVHDDAGRTQPATREAEPPRRLRWAGGAALAASVALVAVFATRPLPEPVSPPVPVPVQPMVAAAAPETPVAPDAANEAPPPVAAPDPAPAAASAVLAAVAATELPRRNAARRAATQRQQVASGRRDDTATTAPVVLASASFPPAADAPSIEAVFPDPPALQQPRPWPRAILPGATDSALTVGYGQLPAMVGGMDDDDPFRPRIELRPVSLQAPGNVADPANDDGPR